MKFGNFNDHPLVILDNLISYILSYDNIKTEVNVKPLIEYCQGQNIKEEEY